MKKILTTIFILAFFISFNHSNAQLQATMDGIEISSNPDSPIPGESVDVSVSSFLIDLDSASIVWLVDGKVLKKGAGVKNITITAPKAGVKMLVTALIKSNNEREVQKNLIIKSGSVEIIWESGGYTPPFFKGKNSFAYQNKVKFIAIPHLSENGKGEINPKNLVYKWKLGNKYIDSNVGYGRQSIEIKADIIPKTLEISVDVYNREQTEYASAKLNIIPTEPSIELYKTAPLYGTLFNKALSKRVFLDTSEINILAVPFGFNTNKNTNPLIYTWSINNIEQSNLLKNQSIILKTKSDVGGSSEISLDVKNIEEILQGARASVLLDFKKK